MKRITIAVGIVVALAFGFFWYTQEVVRPRSNRVAGCFGNAKQINAGLQQYAAEHHGAFPMRLGDVDAFKTPSSVLHCPFSSDSNDTDYTDYYLVPSLAVTTVPKQVLVFCQQDEHLHLGGPIVWSDESVEWCSASEYKKVTKGPNNVPEDTAHKLADPQH